MLWLQLPLWVSPPLSCFLPLSSACLPPRTEVQRSESQPGRLCACLVLGEKLGGATLAVGRPPSTGTSCFGSSNALSQSPCRVFAVQTQLGGLSGREVRRCSGEQHSLRVCMSVVSEYRASGVAAAAQPWSLSRPCFCQGPRVGRDAESTAGELQLVQS